MGTPDTQAKREKLFAERTRLEDMYENKEIPQDIMTAKKMADYVKEQLGNKPGVW